MLVRGSVTGPGTGPSLEKHEGPGRERTCERAAGPGLAHSRSSSGVLGSGWGMGFRGGHHPPQVTREAHSLSSQPRWGAVQALLPSAGQVFIRQRAQAVPAAPGARGAGAMQTPSDSSRSGGETQQRVGQRVQGQKRHWGGGRRCPPRAAREASGVGAVSVSGGSDKEGTRQTYCFRGSFRPASGE